MKSRGARPRDRSFVLRSLLPDGERWLWSVTLMAMYRRVTACRFQACHRTRHSRSRVQGSVRAHARQCWAAQAAMKQRALPGVDDCRVCLLRLGGRNPRHVSTTPCRGSFCSAANETESEMRTP